MSSNEKLKPEFVIGDKALDVSPEDLEKIKNTEVNKNISISDLPTMSIKNKKILYYLKKKYLYRYHLFMNIIN